jgi:hypothetical protein
MVLFRIALFIPQFVVVRRLGLAGLAATGVTMLGWPLGVYLCPSPIHTSR